MYVKVVFLGIYRGAKDIEGYVGSAGGSAQDNDRDCLMFKGTGGNRRKVSLSTARTIVIVLSAEEIRRELDCARTVFQMFDIVVC